MFSSPKSPRPAGLAALGVLAVLVIGSARVAGAQTASPPAAAPAPTTNCAVTTARIGTLDVTQLFGVRDPTMSPTACLRLEVENPTPGDLVPVGGYVMGGFAFDPSSTTGSGVTGVQVFLDDPNQGGSVIGSTTPKTLGLASARAANFGDQFANSGFNLTVQIPASAGGATHAIFVVAQAATGSVGTVAVPVAVGNLTPAVPTRTP
jgi:hypothetical protein